MMGEAADVDRCQSWRRLSRSLQYALGAAFDYFIAWLRYGAVGAML